MSDEGDNEFESYLTSFNKGMEEEAGQAGDDVVEIIEPAKSDDTNKDDGNLFIDQSENYYYPVGDNNDSIEDPFNTNRRAVGIQTKSKNTVVEKVKNEDDNINEETDYVLILNNATGKEIDADDINADDPEKGSYTFNEIDTDDGNADSDDILISKNVIRLKSNSSDAAATPHRCIHCDYTTSKRYLLSRHLRTHSDDRPFRCSVCERGFKSNASLLNHLNTHLGNKPHPCKNCEAAFTTSGELVRHVRYKHTLEKPHKCTECEYASVELSKLKRHMRCHTGERPYQCPHCTYASPDTFKLKRHMRTHTGEKPYECDICHSRFSQSNSMKTHRMIHTVGEKPVFQCSLCPTTCGRKTDLRIHIQKLHHSDKPINCKRCGQSFADRYSYKVHIKTHEGEKCYRCTSCPYASISARHLESHMLVHTDKKPFICEICEMSFRQKQLLRRHINLYHNKFYVPPKPLEKRHNCPNCNRSFSHKGNLIRHMVMHDPDSNWTQEKLNLKLGRKKRLSNEGGAQVAISELETEEYYDSSKDCYEGTEEEYEIIETTDDADLKQKQSVLNRIAEDVRSSTKQVQAAPYIKTVTIKKEPDGKEFVAVEGTDGQQYMVVEVIHCADDEEDETEEANSEINVQMDSSITIVDASKLDVDNCFGFEDADDEYVDDSDNKETIQLLDIIDDE